MLKKIINFVSLVIISCTCLTSCGILGSWDGSFGQQVVQHYNQRNQGGTYVGNYSSEGEASRAAVSAGFKYYQYYPSTGECFGY